MSRFHNASVRIYLMVSDFICGEAEALRSDLTSLKLKKQSRKYNPHLPSHSCAVPIRLSMPRAVEAQTDSHVLLRFSFNQPVIFFILVSCALLNPFACYPSCLLQLMQEKLTFNDYMHIYLCEIHMYIFIYI